MKASTDDRGVVGGELEAEPEAEAEAEADCGDHPGSGDVQAGDGFRGLVVRARLGGAEQGSGEAFFDVSAAAAAAAVWARVAGGSV